MKLGFLTSSRADFGIYLPLLNKIKEDNFFEFEIIAFGSHLSVSHGFTKTNIIEYGFCISHEIQTIVDGDSSFDISSSMAKTILNFATFWKDFHHKYDWVFCLGDRYEMFAAIMSGIPFNIRFAHIHGGEKTLGAIDNVFRHSITLASHIHFTSLQIYAERVLQLLDSNSPKVYNVGALSLDNISNFQPCTKNEFKSKWGVDFNNPTILITFHPETISPEFNQYYSEEIVKTILNHPQYQFLITMPNADTFGNVIRNTFIKYFGKISNIFMIENLGTYGYFSAMYYCCFLIGNTSSGIIEAASFRKYVINLGDRQKGREYGKNVINSKIDNEQISWFIKEIGKRPKLDGSNIYSLKGNAADKIIQILKEEI